eukprot:3730396-Pyramimonas_sp.AAC.1
MRLLIVICFFVTESRMYVDVDTPVAGETRWCFDTTNRHGDSSKSFLGDVFLVKARTRLPRAVQQVAATF